MLRITKSRSAAAAKAYFREALHVADYYCEGREVTGKWHGLAAARLGLVGDVTQDEFNKLIENRTPRGEKLTPRDKADRVPGMDFTLSAPKGVSLLWAMTEDERIVEAHRQAVFEAMGEVERNMETRVRTGKHFNSQEKRKSGNIVWAEFLHDTARPIDGVPDPLLHTHAYVINATWDKAEGRYKAAEIGNIAGERDYYNAVYLSALAREMKKLGFDIERRGKWWDVAGLSRPLIEKYSRRTQAIEAAAKAEGVHDADAKAELGKRTRERKTEEVLGNAVHDEWRARLTGRERGEIERVLRRAGEGTTGRQIGAAQAWSYAVNNALERKSVATEKAVLADAMRYGYGDVTMAELKAASSMTGLIRGEIDGRAVITTKDILAEEERMIGFARKGRLSCLPLGCGDYAIQSKLLNDQQKAAIEHVWHSPDRVMILRGGAGVGKTTLLKEAVAGLIAADHKVFAFAPTKAAVDELQKDVDPRAETIKQLLVNKELQAGLRGGVAVVDEAGLMSVPDMAQLFALAETQDFRVILSGDRKQHSSVERGDALRLLELRAGIRPAQVTEIVRQRGDYKDAVSAVERGEIAEAWRMFENMGAIIEVEGDERINELAADYLAEVEDGRSVLVVSPTHREKNAVSAAIREKLREKGLIGKENRMLTVLRDTGWTAAERVDGRNYRAGQVAKFFQHVPGIRAGTRLLVVAHDENGGPVACDSEGKRYTLPLDKADRFKVYDQHQKAFSAGDLIRIAENGSSLDGKRLINGKIYKLQEFDEAGNLVLENGWVVPKDYGNLDHGYCSTSHSAQGRTVDTVLVAMGKDSLPATFLEQFYVTVSRGRSAVRIYTDDREQVRGAISVSGARGSAMELVEGKVDTKLKPISRKERLMDFSESIVSA